MKPAARHLYLIQAILFYATWFLAVYFAGRDQPHLSAIILGVFALLCVLQSEISAGRILCVSLLAAAIDAAVIGLTHAINYAPDRIQFLGSPLWVWIIWLVLIACFGGCLSFLRRLKPGLLVILGAAGGTLSTYSASTFSALTFPHGELFGLSVYGAVWAILLPSTVWGVGLLGKEITRA